MSLPLSLEPTMINLFIVFVYAFVFGTGHNQPFHHLCLSLVFGTGHDQPFHHLCLCPCLWNRPQSTFSSPLSMPLSLEPATINHFIIYVFAFVFGTDHDQPFHHLCLCLFFYEPTTINLFIIFVFPLSLEPA